MTQTIPAFTGRLVTPADEEFEESVLGLVFSHRRPDAVLLGPVLQSGKLAGWIDSVIVARDKRSLR